MSGLKTQVISLILFSLFCFTSIITGGCSSLRPSWISNNTTNDNELGGHFEGEEWVPDNPAIEATYKLPDISAGFIFDAHSLELTPCLQVELIEFDIPLGHFLRYIKTWKIDIGCGYQRAYGYAGILWTSIFEISTGGFVGWNLADKEISYGFGATIIKF